MIYVRRIQQYRGYFMDSPLKADRNKRDWSQTDVAKRVGLTAPQISRIEKGGVNSPFMKKILKLVEIFDYSLSLDQICNPKKYVDDDEAA